MKLVINEPPIPQSRPRFNSQNKRAYEKSNIKSYKQRIGYAARKEFKKPIERDIPLEINMKFYMPIPQYLSKVKKNRLMLEKEVKYVTKKPDLDNLLKAILDSLNGIAYFDDGQVVKLSVEKVYSFNPRTEINMKFYMPIPQYLSKVKKNRLMLEKEVKYVTKKPDLDNLLKAILDSLNGIAYFDDGQVVKLSVEKVYSFNPRTEINMKFYMPIPQYLSKVKKNRLMLEKEVKYVTKKPDLDNLLKAILDSLNGIAYFDDGQVVKLSVEKVYSFNPRTEIEIKVIEE